MLVEQNEQTCPPPPPLPKNFKWLTFVSVANQCVKYDVTPELASFLCREYALVNIHICFHHAIAKDICYLAA